MKYHLVCISCSKKYESDYTSQICGACSGILDVRYDGIPRIAASNPDFVDYERVLPEGRYPKYIVGNTRLVQSPTRKNVFLKMEIENPTHSFKDRGSIIEIGKAEEYGFDEVVCASTGNMAYSIAYYAKLFGMKARVFLSNDANKDKVYYIKSLGDADVQRINGDFNKAQEAAIKYSKRKGAFLCGDYCYRKEGQKIIAYEIMLEMRNVDMIFVPVGNATLLSGVLRAIVEMKDSGKISKMPKVIGVQSSECDPLVRAFESGKRVRYVSPKTDADAIAVGFPTFGDSAASLLRDLGGIMARVDDARLRSEQKEFFERSGILAELAAVASLSAEKALNKKGKRAACIISGANL